MSPENRATIAAIGRDLAGMARKNLLGGPGKRFPDRSLQARKELTAMGLTYHDQEAVPRRGEAQRRAGGGAFHRRPGRRPPATDFWGRDAVDFARATTTSRSLS